MSAIYAVLLSVGEGDERALSLVADPFGQTIFVPRLVDGHELFAGVMTQGIPPGHAATLVQLVEVPSATHVH